MTRRYRPARRPPVTPGSLDPKAPIRIADEATHRAWVRLWGDASCPTDRAAQPTEPAPATPKERTP